MRVRANTTLVACIHQRNVVIAVQRDHAARSEVAAAQDNNSSQANCGWRNLQSCRRQCRLRHTATKSERHAESTAQQQDTQRDQAHPEKRLRPRLVRQQRKPARSISYYLELRGGSAGRRGGVLWSTTFCQVACRSIISSSCPFPSIVSSNCAWISLSRLALALLVISLMVVNASIGPWSIASLCLNALQSSLTVKVASPGMSLVFLASRGVSWRVGDASTGSCAFSLFFSGT